MKVPESHPCHGSHFPGNPIVPGVVMLQHILDDLQQSQGVKIIAIKQFKFLQKLQAEQDFDINIIDINEQHVSLTITRDFDIIAKGEFVTQGSVST